MTLTVEDDFRDFVAARWPDLEGVAFVVTLDAATARQVTTDALAGLHQHWREALDEGRPGAMARRSVLSAAVAAAPRMPLPLPARPAGDGLEPADETPPPDAGSSPDPWADLEDDDRVLTALEAELRLATPLERALVGARSVWAARPDEVADLLGMPAGTLRGQADALRARLVATHDAARAADGLAPADWALDVDLDAVVEHLLTGQGDPPDPAALVEHRRRSVQRRSVVTGGAAVVAAGALGWWAVGRRPAAAGAAAGSSATPSGPPGPDDPSWRSVSQWVARGSLASDPRVQGLVITRSQGLARLLFADDVEDRRLVVSGTLNPGTEDLILQVWHGAQGEDPASLQELQLWNPFVASAQDAVALAVPTSPGTLLLVLARPQATKAAYSPTVTATMEGTVLRDWVDVPVRAGLGATRWAQDPGPALRARCGDFDGSVIGTTATWIGQSGNDALAGFAEETTRFVAAAIDEPVDSVTTEVVGDLAVGGGVIDPTAISASGADGRVRVLRTLTAGGAVIRSVRVVDDGRSRMNWLDLEAPAVLPADTPRDEPVVLPLGASQPKVARFLVIAPGAARVQLLSTSPSAYRVSAVTRTRTGGVAILEVPNAGDGGAFRLVGWDARGRRIDNGVPRAGQDLLDLWSADQQVVVA